MSTSPAALSLGTLPIARTWLVGQEADRATALLLQLKDRLSHYRKNNSVV